MLSNLQVIKNNNLGEQEQVSSEEEKQNSET